MFKPDMEAVYLQICKLFWNGKNPQISYVKRLAPDDDNFASTPNLTHARIYKLLGKEILKHGVWDDFPDWDRNGRRGILFGELFFWWAFGGTSWVSTFLPYEQQMTWKRDVLRGDAGKNLGWMVTLTKINDLRYPVKFPEGKLKPAGLLIHETSDTEMLR